MHNFQYNFDIHLFVRGLYDLQICSRIWNRTHNFISHNYSQDLWWLKVLFFVVVLHFRALKGLIFISLHTKSSFRWDMSPGNHSWDHPHTLLPLSNHCNWLLKNKLPNFQISWSDWTKWKGISLAMPVMTTRLPKTIHTHKMSVLGGCFKNTFEFYILRALKFSPK